MTKEIEVSKEKELLNLVVSSLKPGNNLNRITDANRQSLKELLSYFSKLKKESVLTEKQFSGLVTLACVNYIENEVEARLAKRVNDKILFFLQKM